MVQVLEPPSPTNPRLPPELWATILGFAARSLGELDRLSVLCRAIRSASWNSPSTKASLLLRLSSGSHTFAIAEAWQIEGPGAAVATASVLLKWCGGVLSCCNSSAPDHELNKCPLFTACFKRSKRAKKWDPSLAKLLIPYFLSTSASSPSSSSCCSPHFESVFLVAARDENDQILRGFLESGQPIHETLFLKSLRNACRFGRNADLLIQYCMRYGRDIIQAEGGALLRSAIVGNHIQVVHSLIRNQVQVDTRNVQTAVSSNNFEMVNVLISACSGLTVPSSTLHMAVRNSFPVETIKLLIAKLDASQSIGTFTIELAVSRRDAELVAILLGAAVLRDGEFDRLLMESGTGLSETINGRSGRGKDTTIYSK
ncbi:hypothetical protein BCR33DRAFT_722103 [Rhizoclosmatium globosum]|uniref:Uncharacterized protein n=1 Tax=Rhizoclosmatium globosum TaxID=329046 RepID=A0A1Y2BNH1_9FUNG|nr:hypothetical protein BCR33DRAFT_722103 [Rhizoclosmatium globosum]|eukprot:ORY36300.1 hypothetical protein BCR33DRAFT_722103 [Rhizoclosmatium globosum]